MAARTRTPRSKIESDPSKALIERALAMGIPVTQISRRFGYSEQAITRYRDRMPQQLKAAILAATLRPQEADLDRLRIEEGEGLLGGLAHQRARLLLCQDESMEAGEIELVAMLSRVIHTNLQLVGRYLGMFAQHHTSTSVSVLLSEDYLRLRQALILALKPYPEARRAVAEAMQRIEGETAGKMTAEAAKHPPRPTLAQPALAMIDAEAQHSPAFTRGALDPTSIARDVGLDQLDPWQARLIDEPPKRLLCLCGRQTGKSTAASLVALNAALYAAPSTIIMISPSLRQSMELFRTLHAMWQTLPGHPVAAYETLTCLELSNGSRIVSLPGSGDTIRGIPAVDLAIVDEAARVSDDLMSAVRPMLATSDGSLFALSTPAGRRGWFFEQWENGVGWSRISVKSTECPRISQEFLAQERAQLGSQLFSQEYECTFNDEVGAAFLSELVDRAFVDDIAPFLHAGAAAVARSA
jgi:hypothetical protein